MDNRIFNVNGRTKEQLQLTLQLALFDEYSKSRKVEGWKISPKKGFILLWHCSLNDHIKFPVPLNFESITDIVWEWLKTDEAKKIEHSGWDINADHDGDNELGWRVYCEDWGHVDSDHYAIMAIKPAYLWYGK